MTILCTDFEAEVLLNALDHLANDLITEPIVALPLVGVSELVIDTATELAQRIDEQLHPEKAVIRVERERMQDHIGSMIAVFSLPSTND